MTLPWRIALVLSVFLMGATIKAAAWESRGGGNTLRVGFEEERQGGALVGCDLSFTQVAEDDVDRHGAIILVNFLLSIIKPTPTNVAFFLKASGEDQNSTNPSQFTPFSPSYAYILANGYSSVHRESQILHCDGPGFCAGYFSGSDVLQLLKVALSPTFTAGIQRRPESLDISFLARISPNGSPSAPDDTLFAACVNRLVNSRN